MRISHPCRDRETNSCQYRVDPGELDPGRSRVARRGFSLLELLVVIAVTVILTGLLLPAFAGVRENLNQIVCASRQRQLGFGMVMYARDNKDRLPPSRMLEEFNSPQELMVARIGSPEIGMDYRGWDGLGLLYWLQYCSAPECFYCPSHAGQDTLEMADWSRENRFSQTIYSNYHYSGHLDWTDGSRRSIDRDPDLVLAIDNLPGVGLGDRINHKTGINTLRADGSVRWQADSEEELARWEQENIDPRHLWRRVIERRP